MITNSMVPSPPPQQAVKAKVGSSLKPILEGHKGEASPAKWIAGVSEIACGSSLSDVSQRDQKDSGE